MTKAEMIKIYEDYMKQKGYKNPGIITEYKSEEDTLLDIFSSITGQAFRSGKAVGFDEGYAYAG